MALLTIDDLEGPMDAVIFSEELTKYAEFIHAERMVLVRGQVSLRRETPSVRVIEVYPLERGMELLARSVVIHLPKTNNAEEMLSTMHKIVREYPGNCPLYFMIDTGQGQTVAIMASEEMRVKPSTAFREQAQALLGGGRVEIIGPNGPVGREMRGNESEEALEEEAEGVSAQERD